jgi:hypothetical protein
MGKRAAFRARILPRFACGGNAACEQSDQENHGNARSDR